MKSINRMLAVMLVLSVLTFVLYVSVRTICILLGDTVVYVRSNIRFSRIWK